MELGAEVVSSVLRDPKTAPISETCRATLEFLEKLTLDPFGLGKADVPEGVSRQALREACEVAAAFNVIDRIADAFAFEIPTSADFAKMGRIIYRHGYR